MTLKSRGIPGKSKTGRNFGPFRSRNNLLPGQTGHFSVSVGGKNELIILFRMLRVTRLVGRKLKTRLEHHSQGIWIAFRVPDTFLTVEKNRSLLPKSFGQQRNEITGSGRLALKLSVKHIKAEKFPLKSDHVTFLQRSLYELNFYQM